jgi:ABC-type Zn uptake system ZnuABC Zn-binding protein ZnuA
MKSKLILIYGIIIGILVILSLLLIVNPVKKNTSDKISVVTTLYPLYEFSKEVGGDKAEVSLLLPPGTEAHTFEPRPSDITKISSADMFVYIGSGMEPWAQDILDGAKNPKRIDLDTSKSVTLLKTAEEGGHAHEAEGAFEWAGVFELEKGVYTWSFSKVDGAYADPAIHMVLLKTTSSDSEGIELQEELAITLFSKNAIKKNNGETLNVGEFNYELTFDDTKDVSTFKIEITEKGQYVIYTEHMPTEFESDEHFFKDVNRNDVEALAQEPATGHAHSHGEYDPHFWLDFSQDIKAVDAIAQAYIQKDLTNKEYYLANAEKYKQKLVALDASYKTGLASCKQKEFITGGHNAYTYLGSRYEIGFVAAYGVSPDSEPTPKAIKEISDLAAEHKIKYVLVEELVSPRMAEAIANDAGAEILVFNPGHNLLKKEFDEGVTFISLMEANLVNLEKALECN